MIKSISKILSFLIGACVAIAAFMAYFMRSVDTQNGIVYDGLGRILTEPPLWASFLITSENSWAGLGWHLLDIIWFFGGLFIAFKLYDWGQESKAE